MKDNSQYQKWNLLQGLGLGTPVCLAGNVTSAPFPLLSSSPLFPLNSKIGDLRVFGCCFFCTVLFGSNFKLTENLQE